LDVSLREMMLLIKIVGEPGTQGVVVAGIQGIGVSTPIAAEVAEATVGLAKEEQRPKGKIFAMDL
jgi:hypothetical protein